MTTFTITLLTITALIRLESYLAYSGDWATDIGQVFPSPDQTETNAGGVNVAEGCS